MGNGTTFYVGSIPTGAIYQGDLETGEGGLMVPAKEGGSAIGLAFDSRTGYLFASGGGTGSAAVYDTSSGELVTEYKFTSEATFVNDVVVTPGAAYFTDSSRPVLYRVPLSPDGRPGEPSAFEEIALGGEFSFVANSFNSNGIGATPDGEWLIVVHSAQGELYRVDSSPGDASRIDLGDEILTNGDGILLDGHTLYVVQNRMNQIAIVELDADMASGTVVRTITDPAFRVPTTIAAFGNWLYAVNARFGVEVTAETEYEVVRVAKG